LRKVGENAFLSVPIRPTLPTKKCCLWWINLRLLTFHCLSLRFQNGLVTLKRADGIGKSSMNEITSRI
jgi:hypothetical protein